MSMKVKVKCSENFQEVEFETEVESLEQLTGLIQKTREAIKQATSDIKKKEDPRPKKRFIGASQKQLDYLYNLGWVGDEESISTEEASRLIEELGGGQRRSR